MAAPSAPHEQQQETEEDHPQEGDATHRRGDQDGGEVQGELEENTRAVHVGVVEKVAAVQRAVEEEGGGGVQRLTTHCKRSKVGVVTSGVAGDADVRPAVRELSVADLQRAAWQDGDAARTLGGDSAALRGNPDDGGGGISFSSAQKTHGLTLVSDDLRWATTKES